MLDVDDEPRSIAEDTDPRCRAMGLNLEPSGSYHPSTPIKKQHTV